MLTMQIGSSPCVGLFYLVPFIVILREVSRHLREVGCCLTQVSGHFRKVILCCKFKVVMSLI